MNTNLPVIAVLGGSGNEGAGLALRWALAGHAVIIGSRTLERAEAAAEQLNQVLAGRGHVAGKTNFDAANEAEIVVLTVPYAAQLSIALEVRTALEGKILIDVTVPLVPPKVDRVQLPEGGSAVVRLQRELGDGVRVVSAFQNVSASQLKDLDHVVDCDVLVCGDDVDAREQAVRLADAAGMVAWHAGALVNSTASEALTSVLIAINKRYKVHGSGIRITGPVRPERKG